MFWRVQRKIISRRGERISWRKWKRNWRKLKLKTNFGRLGRGRRTKDGVLERATGAVARKGGRGNFKLVRFNEATGLVSPLRRQICLNPVWLGGLRPCGFAALSLGPFGLATRALRAHPPNPPVSAAPLGDYRWSAQLLAASVLAAVPELASDSCSSDFPLNSTNIAGVPIHNSHPSTN